jgi:S1-C subfamily serine protease
MSESDWEFPASVQPKPDQVGFDLDAVLSSVVQVHTEIPEDAFTASILGTERSGNGVVIRDDGLVLTIGYLITEAETVWLLTNTGTAVAGHVVAYDQTTGFGLLQALGRLDVPAIEIGRSQEARVGDAAILAGHGGRRHALNTKIISKREFAGYWEYVLDEAIFTAPPHPNWGGAALIGRDGTLQGIGSLFVQDARSHEGAQEGNMVVPIDLLDPILDDLLRFGRVNKPPRPWLGMYTTDADSHLVVAGLAGGGPAHRAGVRIGDIVVEIGGAPVDDLADLFRRVWAQGSAGVEVPITVVREGEPVRLGVRSADRNDFLKSPKLH